VNDFTDRGQERALKKIEALGLNPYDTFARSVLIEGTSPADFADLMRKQGGWDDGDAEQFLLSFDRIKDDPRERPKMMAQAERQAEDEAFQQEAEKLAKELPDNAFLRNVNVGGAQAFGALGSMLTRPFAPEYSREVYDANQVLDQAAQVADQGSVAPQWANALLRGATRSAVQAGVTSPLGGVGMIAGFAAAESNEALNRATDLEMSAPDAQAYAMRAAAIEGGIATAMQAVGLGGLEKLLGGGGKLTKGGVRALLKQTGVAILQEVPEEVVTELSHNLNAALSGLDPEAVTWERTVQTIAQTTAQTVLTVGMAGAMHGAIRSQPGLRQKQAKIDEFAGKFEMPADDVRAAWETADEKTRTAEQWQQVFESEMNRRQTRQKRQQGQAQADADLDARLREEERQRAKQKAGGKRQSSDRAREAWDARQQSAQETDDFLAGLSDEEFANAFHWSSVRGVEDMSPREQEIYEAMQDSRRRNRDAKTTFKARFVDFRKDHPEWKPNPDFWQAADGRNFDPATGGPIHVDAQQAPPKARRKGQVPPETGLAVPRDADEDLREDMRDILTRPQKYGIRNPDDVDEFMASNSRYPQEFGTILRAKFPSQALTAEQRAAEVERVKDKVVRTDRGRMQVVGVTWDGRYELASHTGESRTASAKRVQEWGGIVEDASDYKDGQKVLVLPDGAKSRWANGQVSRYIGNGMYEVEYEGRAGNAKEIAHRLYSAVVDESQVKLTPQGAGAKRYRDELAQVPEGERKGVKKAASEFDAAVRGTPALYDYLEEEFVEDVRKGRTSGQRRERAMAEHGRTRDARVRAAKVLGIDGEDIHSPVVRAKHLAALRAWLAGPGKTEELARLTENAKQHVERGESSNAQVYGAELRDGDQVLHQGQWLVAEVDEAEGTIQLHDGTTIDLDMAEALSVRKGEIVGADGMVRDAGGEPDGSFDFAAEKETGGLAGSGPLPGPSPESTAVLPGVEAGAVQADQGARNRNPPEQNLPPVPPPVKGELVKGKGHAFFFTPVGETEAVEVYREADRRWYRAPVGAVIDEDTDNRPGRFLGPREWDETKVRQYLGLEQEQQTEMPAEEKAIQQAEKVAAREAIMAKQRADLEAEQARVERERERKQEEKKNPKRVTEYTQSEFVHDAKGQFVKRQGKRNIIGLMIDGSVHPLVEGEQRNGVLLKDERSIRWRIHREAVEAAVHNMERRFAPYATPWERTAPDVPAKTLADYPDLAERHRAALKDEPQARERLEAWRKREAEESAAAVQEREAATNPTKDTKEEPKPAADLASLDDAEFDKMFDEAVAATPPAPPAPPLANDATASPIRDRLAVIAATKGMPTFAARQAQQTHDKLADGSLSLEKGTKALAQIEKAIQKATGRDVAEKLVSQPDLFGKERDLFTQDPPKAKTPPKPKPGKRSAADILKDAAKHGVKGLDDAVHGLHDLFGGSGTMLSGIPRLSWETYQKAKPHFLRAYSEFTAAGKSLADFFQFVVSNFGTNVREYLRAFRDDLAGRLDRTMFEEQGDVPSQSENLEPGSGDGQAPVGLGQDAAGGNGPGDGGPGVGGMGPDQRQGGPEGSAVLPTGTPPAGGARGNRRAGRGGGRSGSARGAARGAQPERGGEPGDAGVPPDREPAEAIDAPAAGDAGRSDPGVGADPGNGDGRPLGAEERRQRQREAESIPVVPGDLENVRQTLPMLFKEQQEDVWRAELRYADQQTETNRGILMTNGTGTGKTFSGLGIVKRFLRQGAKNIIIVVPSQKILTDWARSSGALGFGIHKLKDRKDNGGTSQVVATTYANFQTNEALFAREWDLAVFDEAHHLSSNADGEMTAAAQQMRLLLGHNASTAHIRAASGMLGKLRAAYARTFEPSSLPMEPMDFARMFRTNPEAWRRLPEALRKEFSDRLERAQASKVVMLSATPFAYHKSALYGDGFLYRIVDPGKDSSGAYNAGSEEDRFLMQNFGYRMRYNKLTSPTAEVDLGLMEREFNERLRREGTLLGRTLDVVQDYSRHFVDVEDPDIEPLNRFYRAATGFEESRDKWENLARAMTSLWDYNRTVKVLEAVKARAYIPRIRQHRALGRQVVVFHSRLQENILAPYALPPMPESVQPLVWTQEVTAFEAEHPEFVPLRAKTFVDARTVLSRAFGEEIAEFNGTVTDRNRESVIDAFNDDDSPTRILLVQRDAGKEGMSVHDQTGKYPRVLIDLALPIRPTDFTQTEGRIYRTGQASPAAFEYPKTAFGLEHYFFSSKINQRAGTAENLALGNLARDLRTVIREGYLNSTNDAPSPEQGKGGKEADRSVLDVDDFARAIAFYHAQQKRSKRSNQMGKDYFATPEPLGYKMVEWAGARPGEDALEPSAGHGAIARFFPDTTRRIFVEPSPELSNLLRLNAGGNVRTQGFEDFPIQNKFDVIAMNPPFGHAGATAMEHLGKAFRHLREGGRLVAILPEGSTNAKFDAWYDSPEAKGAYLVAEFGLPAITFEKAGTKVKTRVLVLDKVADPALAPHGQGRRDIDADTIAELFERLRDMGVPPRAEAAPRDEDATATQWLLDHGVSVVEKTTNAGKPYRFVYAEESTSLALTDLAFIGGRDFSYARPKPGWAFFKEQTVPDIARALGMQSQEEQEAPRYSVRAAEMLQPRALTDEQTVKALRDAFPKASVTVAGSELGPGYQVVLANGKSFVAALVDTIEIDPAAFRATYGRRLRDSDVAAAAWYNQAGILQVAKIARLGDIDHDSWHIAMSLADLTAEDMRAVEAEFGADEERQARGYEAWTGETRTPWGRVFAKIRQFFRKLARALGLRLRDGWQDVFAKVRSGEAFAQTAPQAARAQETAGVMYDAAPSPDVVARDAEYAAAVARGDMETAGRLANEAAAQNGYTTEAYHGTRSQWWTFAPGRTISLTPVLPPDAARWIQQGREQAQIVAEDYANGTGGDRPPIDWKAPTSQLVDDGGTVWKWNGETRRFEDTEGKEDPKTEGEMGEWVTRWGVALRTDEARILRLYVRPGAVLDATTEAGRPAYQRIAQQELDAARASLQGMEGKQRQDAYYEKGVRMLEMSAGSGSYQWQATRYFPREFARVMGPALARHGYGAVLIAEDGGTKTMQVFDPARIKLADPATYDDQGNLIPLSARFNPREDDIRYSVRRGDEQSRLDKVLDPWKRIVGDNPDEGLRYWLRRYLSAGRKVGGRRPVLNEMEQQRKGRMEADTHALHRNMEAMAKDLLAMNRLVAKGTIPAGERAQLDAMLFGTLPVEDATRPAHPVAARAFDAVAAARRQIDILSQQIHDQLGDILPEGLAIAIQENEGKYTLRAYRKFVEPGYKPTREAKEEMEQALADAIVDRVAGVEERINAAIAKAYASPQNRQALRDFLLTADESILAGRSETFVRYARRFRRYYELLNDLYNQSIDLASKGEGVSLRVPRAALESMAEGTADYLLKKDTSVQNVFGGKASPQWKTIRKSFLKRKELSPVLRAFYGEIRDLAAVAEATIARQNQILAADAFQRELLAQQEALPIGHPDRVLYRSPYTAPDGRHFSFPLHDTAFGRLGEREMYTDHATYDLLQQVDAGADVWWSRWLGKINLVGRYTHTVMNLPTVERNILTNPIQALAGGELTRPSYAKGVQRAWDTFWHDPEELERLIASSLVGSSARSAEIRATVRDAFGETNLLSPSTFLRKATAPLRWAGRKATAFYAGSDNLFKLADYYSKRERGMGHEEAVRRVRETYPYYDEAPLLATMILRRAPVGMDFMTIRMEFLRNMVNNWYNAVADAKKGDFHGLAGTLAVHGLGSTKWGMTMLVGGGIAMAISALTDKDWGTPDKEEEQAARVLSSDWQRHGNLVWLKGPEGDLSSIDAGYILPYDMISKTTAVLADSTTEENKAWAIAKLLGEDYVGLPMGSAVLAELATNKDTRSNQPIWISGVDSVPEATAKVGKHLASRWVPSSFTYLRRAGEIALSEEGQQETPWGETRTAKSELLKGITPLRAQPFNPESSFRARARELYQMLSETRRKESRVRGQVERGYAAEEEWDKADAWVSGKTDMLGIRAQEIVDAALHFLPEGTPNRTREETQPGSLRRILLETGFSRADVDNMVRRRLAHEPTFPDVR